MMVEILLQHMKAGFSPQRNTNNVFTSRTTTIGPVKSNRSCPFLIPSAAQATMSLHNETNPHFIRQQQRPDNARQQPWPHDPRRPQSQVEDQNPHSRPHVQFVPEPEHQGQHPQQHGLVSPVIPHPAEDQHSQPHPRWTLGTQRPGQGTRPYDPQLQQPGTQRPGQGTRPYDQQLQQPGTQRPGQGTRPYDPQLQQPKRKERKAPRAKPYGAAPVLIPEDHGSHSRPHGGTTPKEHQPRPEGRHSRPLGAATQAEQPHRPGRHSQGTTPQHHQHGSGLWVPASRKTKPLTWFAAVFCVIFWIIIILGGLIVLIVYLIFRPRSPRFDVSSVTLNAAYLDMGYLLNADLTILANFTNPNKKVGVDFTYMIIDLYYGNTLIATQYIEPFSAEKLNSKFQTLHMVSSQVRLPIKESLRLQKQMAGNGAIFEVKGLFRARSRLGSVLRYSYWLYAHCNIVLTAPPGGILRSSHCRTKR